MSVEYPPIERREGLARRELLRRYAGRRPVVLARAIAHLPAVERWSVESLAERAAGAGVRVKRNSAARPTGVETMCFGRYLELLLRHEAEREAGRVDARAVPPYLHDTLLLVEEPALRDDLAGFPLELLPAWYRRDWWRLALFFVGARDSLTPMHCDMAETHNLFFQVAGEKRFFVVVPGDRDRCERRGWRGSSIDAEAPDPAACPRFHPTPRPRSRAAAS